MFFFFLVVFSLCQCQRVFFKKPLGPVLLLPLPFTLVPLMVVKSGSCALL